MATFNLYDFARGLTAAATGTLAGQAAARQEQQQQMLQSWQQALGLAQSRAQQEAQQRQQALSVLGQLEAPSQAQLLQGVMQPAPSPLAGLAGHPYARQRPELQALLRGPAAPAPVSPMTPAGTGAPGRTFQSPYGALTLKGFDPKQAQGVLTALKEASRPFVEADLTPEEQRLVAPLLQSLPQSINSVEDLQKAQQLLGNLRAASISMGPRLQKRRDDLLEQDQEDFQKTREWLDQQNDEVWWNQVGGMLAAEKSIGDRRKGRGNTSVYLAPHEKDIEGIRQLQESGQEEEAQMAIRTLRGRLRGGLSEKQEEAASREIRDRLAQMSPLAITPDVVREMYRNWRGRDVSYLIENLPDEALQQGDARLFTRLAQVKGQLAQWVNLNGEAQRILLDEIGDLQRRLGVDIPIPDKIVQQMSPIQREQYLKLQEERTYAAREDRRKDVRLQLDQERARDDRAERERKRRQEAGQLTEAQAKALDAADKEVADAEQRLYKVAEQEKVRPSEITDWNNITDPRQAKYAQAYRELQATREKKRGLMRKYGIDVPTAPVKNVPAISTPREEPPPPSPTLGERAKAWATGAASAVGNAAAGAFGGAPGVPSAPTSQQQSDAAAAAVAKPLFQPFDERAPVKGATLELRHKRLVQDNKMMQALKKSIDSRDARLKRGGLTPAEIQRLDGDVARYNATIPIYRRNVELYNQGVQQMNAATQQQGADQRERRRKIMNDLKRLLPDATPAEINAELRARGLL